MRAYFLRVVVLLLAAPVVLYVLLVAFRLFLPPQTAGLVVGVLALVGVVGGAYAVPLGVDGFAPRVCPHCAAPLR